MFHVIDDEEHLRELLKVLISRAGYDALYFESGDQYLEYFNSPEFQKPIAVLTDVIMPGINGYDLTLEIRKALPHQKIVLITATPDSEHHQRATNQLCYTLHKPYPIIRFTSLLNALTACERAIASGAHSEFPNHCTHGVDHNCPFHNLDKSNDF